MITKSHQRWYASRAASIAAAALLAALVVAGCGSGSDASAPQQPSPAELNTGLRSAKAGRITVALVTDHAGLTEYNALAMKGLQDAIVRLRVKGRVVEPTTQSEVHAAMSELGREKYDLVISLGSNMARVTRSAALRYPDTMFAIVDYAYTQEQTLPNLEGLVFDEVQAGYLAGYLAGKMTRTRVLSTISRNIAPDLRFAQGFRAGAEAANARNRIVAVRVSLQTTARTCKRIARQQVTDRKSDVIFPVAGSCNGGALAVAAERGIWGIGVDTDQARLGPHILTSAIKLVDAAVLDAIQGVANGKVEDSVGTMSPYGFHGGGVTVYGAQYRAIGLGRVSPSVPPRLLARIDVIKRQMTGATAVGAVP